MLDLNLSADSSESTQYQEEGPATSESSSVVNADASNEDACSTRAHPGTLINFDIVLNKPENENDDVVGPTKELFPMTNTGRGEEEVVRTVQQVVPPLVTAKKSRRGPRSRSSQYRGVTFYRRTGRWESHIWDCGKQVYLGGFDTAHAAARAYDRAAIKFRGLDADINFNLSDYEEDLQQTNNLTKEEFVHILRRQSNGFSRGSSKYRGVTLHKCGRWEARMGQFLGKKAYDQAAIKCNGREAVTNFEPSVYGRDMLSAATKEGSDHNLDLNLGISPSGNGSKKSEGGLPYPSGLDMYSNTSRMILGDPLFKGLGPSDQPVLWNSAYPSFFANEERATDKRIELSSSQGFLNGAWQMDGRAIASPTTPFPSAAASSGFSFSVTPHSAAIRPSKPVGQAYHNSPSFATTPTDTTTNCSSFYFPMKLPQPPP